MTTIKLKNGSGAPLAGDLVQGEPALDLTNKRLYTENSSGAVIEVGTNPSTINIDAGTIDGTVIGGSTAAAGSFTTFTSTGIDDNAASTAMTLDSSGKMLIGDSSSHTTDLLQIETPASGGGHGIQIRRNDSNNDQVVGHILFGNNTDTSLTSISAKTDGATDSGALLFNTSATGGSNTERMRLDSSGNVGIGISSGLEKFTVVNSSSGIVGRFTNNTNQTLDLGVISGSGASGGVFYNNANSGYHAFQTGGTERLRIDASGNLFVGTTSQINSGKTNILGTSTTNVLGLRTDNGNYLISGFSSTTEVFRVASTGNVTNTNNSYGSLSDERLKSNIVDASSQLDDIMAVQVRSYTLNSTGETHIGVVAQELEASGMSGIVEEDKEGMKSVKYSVLYMKAIKALQEQNELINDLRARVAQLETN